MTSLEQLKSRDAFAAVKENVPAMETRLREGALLFSTPPEPMAKYGEYDYHHSTWELLEAMAGMLQKGVPAREEERVVPIPQPIIYSVQEKSRELIEYLRKRESSSLSALYAMASRFLSLLTMCSMGSVTIAREGADYTVRFTGGDTEAILENMDYG